MTVAITERDITGFSFRERVCILREVWRRIHALLNVYCSGYLIIPDEQLNILYLKLCLLFEKVASTPGLEEIALSYMRPFESLYENEMDIEWEFLERNVSSLKGKIDEWYILAREGAFADLQILDILWEVDRHLQEYFRRKQAVEKTWIEDVKHKTEAYRVGSETKQGSEPEKPKLGFLK